MNSLIGKEIRNYRIISMIGEGGIGIVYLAEHVVSCTQKAAIKVIKADLLNDLTRQILDDRAKYLAGICCQTPSIVSLFDFHIDKEGNTYIFMEYVEGETIEQHVNKCGAYSLDEAINLMFKILEAVQCLHDRQLIHRHITPSTIMIRSNKSICIDFDISKDTYNGETGKTVGRFINIDGYKSPEQVIGQDIDHRTDIYSLGCVFYYLITGQHAVQETDNNYTTIANILYGIMPHPSQMCSSIPASIDGVFLRSVDKNKMERYNTVSEFGMALKRCLRERFHMASPPG